MEAHLNSIRRKEEKTFRFRNLEHDRFDLELTSSGTNRLEINTEYTGRFTVESFSQIQARKGRETVKTHQF